MKKIISVLACLAVFAVSGYSQVKIYTKKSLLQDFPDKIVKVVISSSSPVELAFKDEIRARWTASPFEFCSPEDYEALKENNDYYFLRLVSDGGIVCLSLTKGGKPKDVDTKARPVNVVEMAIGSENEFGIRTLMLLGDCVDIVQKYALENVEKEVIGYSGLSKYNERNMEGMRVCVDGDMGDDLLDEKASGTLVFWSVYPLESGKKSVCYHMLVSADTRELYMYVKCRYRGPEDAAMSAKERARIVKRGGIFIE